MRKSKKEPGFAERVKQGLEQALRHVRGEIKLRTTILELPKPPPAYSAKAIRRIRTEARMAPTMFADLLNVSVKTVDDWEKGRRKPSRTAQRLLQLMDVNPAMVYHIAGGRRTVTMT